ncbi:hypothetical protein [Paludibacterium denitrificans]|uniref:Uncharacterized protein n=1 Tax=Paludibacterium denitrificans TaxID=2675226 RepID=A0A844GC44_9NEIS|nr:hypothetical protein [Paludibacterium denitrificans]MTD32477.1 hypothetical protein [Paludibacterium denitrificans]
MLAGELQEVSRAFAGVMLKNGYRFHETSPATACSCRKAGRPLMAGHEKTADSDEYNVCSPISAAL